MTKVGALGRGGTNAVVYFCSDCSRDEAIRYGVPQFIAKSAYQEDEILNNIELLAIESSDNVHNDIKLVGLVFYSDDGDFKSLLLSHYEDLKSYFFELVG